MGMPGWENSEEVLDVSFPLKGRAQLSLSKALPVRRCTTHFSFQRPTREEKPRGIKSKNKTKNTSHIKPEVRELESSELLIIDTVVARVPAFSSTVVANTSCTSRPEAEKGEPYQANMQAVNFRNVSNHALIGSVSEARIIDAVLHLIRAQGRVVRQEARTRSC